MRPHVDGAVYVFGDFAAWCERMLAERRRTGGAGSDPSQWATPDEGMTRRSWPPGRETSTSSATWRSSEGSFLALRELALGIEGLERFVRREPLRRVPECVFGD